MTEQPKYLKIDEDLDKIAGEFKFSANRGIKLCQKQLSQYAYKNYKTYIYKYKIFPKPSEIII